MSLADSLAKHYQALWVCPFHQAVAATTVVIGLTTTSYLLLMRRSAEAATAAAAAATATATTTSRATSRATTPSPPPPLLRQALLSPRVPRSGTAAASSSSSSPPPPPPYPLTQLPGSRLVDTPHGTMLVAEMGPATGRKIVLVHGMSTPSIIFGPLATALAADGYRVLTFDLFGRGYSDAPVGAGAVYDERLFCAQLLYALYASPLSWDRFSVVGYSLGGGIAVAFAACFGARIDALVLLAPSGVLRASRLSLPLRLARSGWLPAALEALLVGLQLRRRTRYHAHDPPPPDGLDYAHIMAWQAGQHPGFLRAFAASFRDGPIYDRHAEWRSVARQRLVRRIGVLLGERDDVIPPDLLPEMVALLGGAARVRGEVLVGAGHSLVKDRWRDCLDFVFDIVGYPDDDDDDDDNDDDDNDDNDNDDDDNDDNHGQGDEDDGGDDHQLAGSQSSFVVDDF